MGNLKEKLTAAVTGDVVLLPAFSAVFVMFAYAYHLLHPDWMSDLAAITLIAFGILFLFFGMFIGIRSYNRNGFLWQVFSPTRQKLILSASISLLITIAAIFIKGSGLSYQKAAVDFIGLSLYIYPFAALAYTVKDGQLLAACKRWMISLLILLNPIFIFALRMMAVSVNNEIYSEACGVSILSMADDSPAMAAGLAVGEVMNSFSEDDIRTLEDMRAFMADSKGDLIFIKTIDSEYGVKPLMAGERYILGIVGETAYCGRDFLE
jgi:hypothetical protein